MYGVQTSVSWSTVTLAENWRAIQHRFLECTASERFSSCRYIVEVPKTGRSGRYVNVSMVYWAIVLARTLILKRRSIAYLDNGSVSRKTDCGFLINLYGK